MQYIHCTCLRGGINSLHKPTLGRALNSAAWGPAEEHWDTFVSIVSYFVTHLQLCKPFGLLHHRAHWGNKLRSGWRNQNKGLINELF